MGYTQTRYTLCLLQYHDEPLVFTKKNKAVQHKAFTSALPGKFEELGLTCSCGVQSTLDTLNLPSGRVTA